MAEKNLLRGLKNTDIKTISYNIVVTRTADHSMDTLSTTANVMSSFMLQIHSDKARTRELLTILFKSTIRSIHQMKIVLIKTGQSELLQYLARSKNEDEHIMKVVYGRCFIHLQHDIIC